MEYDTEEDTNEEGGVLQRIKESPRTVSALIIILIVAAAIYAFSGNQPENTDDVALLNDDTTEEQANMDTEDATESPATSPEATTSPKATAMMTAATPAATVAPKAAVSTEELKATTANSPEARKTDSGYVEVAQAGDGVTHLARRATARYLAENNAGYTVTNEHRIYIEDYIKDRLGSKPLSIGGEETISFDLLKEAVASAQNLSETQLLNLSHYTSSL